MPLFEIAFAEVAPELFAEEAATTLGAEALGAEALGALTAGEVAGLGLEAAGAAPGITQAGMEASAASGGAGAGAAGINAAQVGAQQAAAQQVANAGINAIPEAQQAYQAASTASVNPGIVPGTQPLPAYPNDFSSVNNLMQPNGGAPMDFGPPVATPTPTQFTTQQISDMIAKEQAAAAPSALEEGFKKAVDWAKENPFQAMTGAYMGASALGLLNPSGATFNAAPYNGPLSKYKLAENFQGRNVNPADFQYTPRYVEGGGIMGANPTAGITPTMGNNPMMNNSIQVGSGGSVPNYASGGSLADSIASYQKMLSGNPVEAPAASRDVGIYYDQDPDTRYQDALTAAQIRQAKVNQRAYVSPPAAKRPTPMGQLQMASVKAKKQSDSGGDVEAAQGGIMHTSLGGYAAGGNPRLLKGPGDGMSDNIPATINGRQPARLADGEFVIPADVVSHLGNGSTEAGAKQLHGMMDKVRSARTGNKKQGKQINPQKYMPK